MKKLIVISFIIALTLCGCAAKTESTDKTDNTSKEDTVTQATYTADADTPAYYFINGLLLGSYDKDGWHSLCDNNYDFGPSMIENAEVFYAKDILKVPKYHIYDNDQYIGDAGRIIWMTEVDDGLGSFETEGVAKKFAKYGEIYQDKYGNNEHRVFQLPLTLGDELEQLEIPTYSFYTDFILENQKDSVSSKSYIATNSSSELYPRKLNYRSEVTSAGETALTNLFKTSGIGNTLPNFTDCISGDFDNDGKDEYLMVANNPFDDTGYPIIIGEGQKDQVGTFSALLYEDDDGGTQVIHNYICPVEGTVTFENGYYNSFPQIINHCYQYDLVSLADLNGDGKYEISLDMPMWEWGHTFVFSQNQQGDYEMVMRSDSGT